MSLRVLAAVPGWAGREAALRGFLRGEGEGVVTSFVDSALPPLHAWLEDEETGDVEATTFADLAGMVARLVSGTLRKLPSGALVRRLVTTRLAVEPGPFGRLAHRPEFAERLLESLEELRAWGWRADDVEAAAAGAPAFAAEALEALAELDRHLDREIERRGKARHSDHLDAAAGEAADLDDSLGRLLVFTDGAEHPRRCAFLRWLADRGVAVTVVTERHPGDGPVFAGSRRIEGLLGAPVTRIGAGHRAAARLFGAPDAEGFALDVREIVATDPASEAEWLVREAAFAPGSAILTREAAAAERLHAASRRLGVPLSVRRSAPIRTSAFVSSLRACLHATVSDDPEAWRELLHGSSMGLAPPCRSAILKWVGAPGRGRRELVEACADDDASADRLGKLLDWMETARKPAGGEDWSSRLKALAEDVPWAGSGRLPERVLDRENRAVGALLREFSAALSTGADGLLSIEDVAGIVDAIVEETDHSVPRPGEGIRVASHPAALPPAAVLLVAGMIEGVYPRGRREDPILLDEIRRHLNVARPDLPPLPLSADRAAQEDDDVARAVSFATRTLVVSRSLRSGEGAAVPSSYLPEILGHAPAEQPHPVVPHADDPLAREADRRLRAAMEAEPILFGEIALLSEAARAAVAGEDGPLTVDELEDAAGCPLKFAFRHRLEVRPTGRVTRLPWRQAATRLAQETDLDREGLREELAAGFIPPASRNEGWAEILMARDAGRLAREFVEAERSARKAWGLGPGTVGEGAGRLPARLKRGGAPPPVHPSPRWTVATIASNSVGVGELSDRDRVRVVAALGEIFRPGMPVAVQVVRQSGKRSLVVFGERATGLPASGSDRLGYTARRETPVEFVRESEPLFRRIALVAREGDGRATPEKEVCARCDLGEVCRRHAAYGEAGPSD